jgi:hypothetical protein
LSSRSLTKLAGGLKGSGGSSPAITVHDIDMDLRMVRYAFKYWVTNQRCGMIPSGVNQCILWC